MTEERPTPEPGGPWGHEALDADGWVGAAPVLDSEDVPGEGVADPWAVPAMPPPPPPAGDTPAVWGDAEPVVPPHDLWQPAGSVSEEPPAPVSGAGPVPVATPGSAPTPAIDAVDATFDVEPAFEPGPPRETDPAGPQGILPGWSSGIDRPPTSWAETASARAHLGPTMIRDDDPGGRVALRAADGRLARVHLRGGLLTLARASLEQMAGVGALDREALVDLAEARWRSGDLEGAAEAATAHLDAAGDEPLAHLIVAEEADRQGSLVDARRHAAVVRERVGTGLDRLFAGEVRSTAWPMEAVDWMDEGATGPGRWGLLAGGREVAEPEPSSWRMLPPPSSGSPVARPRVALAVAAAAAGPSTLDQMELGRVAGAELEAAELELARGAIADAVDRLSLVLRFDPALAPVILSMADRSLMAPGDRQQGLVALQLLRGDANRVLGRELEAVDAYQESMRALSARATVKESQ